mmetsp:Transcript_125381/g.279780  ORF Transcript_125381/g.279780 Transcript_125381/m.279780 type:complete len:390 (-) Transcript_125381:228-1397(-)
MAAGASPSFSTWAMWWKFKFPLAKRMRRTAASKWWRCCMVTLVSASAASEGLRTASVTSPAPERPAPRSRFAASRIRCESMESCCGLRVIGSDEALPPEAKPRATSQTKASRSSMSSSSSAASISPCSSCFCSAGFPFWVLLLFSIRCAALFAVQVARNLWRSSSRDVSIPAASSATSSRNSSSVCFCMGPKAAEAEAADKVALFIESERLFDIILESSALPLNSANLASMSFRRSATVSKDSSSSAVSPLFSGNIILHMEAMDSRGSSAAAISAMSHSSLSASSTSSSTALLISSECRRSLKTSTDLAPRTTFPAAWPTAVTVLLRIFLVRDSADCSPCCDAVAPSKEPPRTATCFGCVFVWLSGSESSGDGMGLLALALFKPVRASL